MGKNLNILFPFHEIKKGSRIVLYGAGDIGQTFYLQVIKTGFCEIVGWIDARWEQMENLRFPLCHKRDLENLEYDRIVVAVKDEKAVRQISQELGEYGVEPASIFHSSEYVGEFPLCAWGKSENTSFVENLYEYMGIEGEAGEKGIVAKVQESDSAQKNISIGFLAVGYMAEVMAETIEKRMGNVTLQAAASRDSQKAEKFAEKHHFKKYYGSYEELVSDPDVDLVYIASPVACHYEHVKMSLEHGKHVLCEKPFTQNAEQAEKLLALAKEKNLLLADGLWTSYLPMALKIKEIVQSGAIGKICTVNANAFYPIMQSENSERGAFGGALLELGLYLLSFVTFVLGYDITGIEAAGMLNEDGVDLQDAVVLHYPDKMAVLNFGMMGVSDRTGYIYGKKGYIEINDANEYRKIRIFNKNNEMIETHETDSGYQYELLSCIRAVRDGKLECGERTHEDILKIMKLADGIRERIGESSESVSDIWSGWKGHSGCADNT